MLYVFLQQSSITHHTLCSSPQVFENKSGHYLFCWFGAQFPEGTGQAVWISSSPCCQTMWHSQGVLTIGWGNGLEFLYTTIWIFGTLYYRLEHKSMLAFKKILCSPNNLPSMDAKLNKSSQTRAIMGDCNYLIICWRSNTVNHKSIDNFLTQAVEDPTRIMCCWNFYTERGIALL